jgi:hypothetical protein
MVPHCFLQVNTFVYIGRQKERWSDQWFSLPRSLASDVLNLVNTDLKPYCVEGDPFAHIIKHKSPGFEFMVFDALKKYEEIHHVKIVDSLLPRILARDRSISRLHDMKMKCERFLWFVTSSSCVHAMMNSGY